LLRLYRHLEPFGRVPCALELDVKWLGICIKLRASGMPLSKIRCYAELVREGPGNENERLALLRDQEQRVEGQLAEVGECLRTIKRKVSVYEQHLTRWHHCGSPGSPA
jgi:DNA-binding transcriptional MerR regulator